MEQQVKIAIELHEGEKSTKKIWRFDVSSAKSFTKSLLVNEIEGLFPHIKKKGLSLSLYHCDELARKVVIESDADSVEALRNFIEESLHDRRPMYMVLHADDTIPSPPEKSEDAASRSSSKDKMRKV